MKRSSDTASASRTVSPEKSRESWKERPSPSRARAAAVRSVTSTPANSTMPSSGRRKPEMTSNSVVLPAPLGPMIPTISPWSACRVTSIRAALPPNCSETPRTSRARAAPSGAAAPPAGASDSEAFLHVNRPQQLGVGRQLVGRAGEAHGAVLHDVDPVGHRHGDVHRLLHQQDGRSGVAHRLDGAQQLLDDKRGEPERELVDQEQVRAG